ncbi:hypothetical protein CDL15_Pgr000886 [Punica granatum]|uniref:non-specific serine/threonine protein kinase n=1 Tax=Punica granatum TaxID=22663 RepID=A0A218XHN0_PUNGR|nr:hypothetical protein CDL15_Pgr000886 [Punica granatum]
MMAGKNKTLFGSIELLLLLWIAATVSVHGQLQTGFISIDCGGPVNFRYVDIDTGISYSTDGDHIDSGINRNISSKYAYPNNPNLPQTLSDLRSFPHGDKNCYSLRPADGNASLNLIRASFLYGDYDGLNNPPQFNLYLDASLWATIKFKNSSDVVTTEIVRFATSNVVYVCLVNTGNGVPFISGLELRPLNRSIYITENREFSSLVLFERLNIGSSNSSSRYQDDIYDRIWPSYMTPSWDQVNTSMAINTNENGYKAPFQVIHSAARPKNGTGSLELQWTSSDENDQFFIFLYFAEVEALQKNQSRKFNVSWNGSQLFGPFTPRYLYATTLANPKALVGKNHRISVDKTDDSTLPPILNAVEIYRAMLVEEFLTNSADVDAIYSVKSTYRINKNWGADPCGPQNYSWEGLTCNYSFSVPPRIVSLNLSSSGLSGTITSAFAQLSSLESLDLSNNSLSGPVPQILNKLKFLNFLNLKGNQFSGTVPEDLIKRSNDGSLTLSVDNQNLCGSDSCKRKKKILIPIIVPLSIALILIVALLILLNLRRKRKLENNPSDKERRYIASKKRHFTYAEVVTITNNFQTVIGKGGFGNVYLGQMRDGTKVAVKMLSPSSSQGPREFEAEAELLLTVHHRNLASFIGYCDDLMNMALIYEYLANGNLKNFLSDRSSSVLTWELRLRIAIDAAQGLEYLHHGCKPPIIHRDVKTANILLSENMDAKIADFGLSKVVPSDGHSQVMTAVMGTTGYLDPEYYITQKLNEKSDVYSFGMVLLELITGQSAIIKGEEHIHILEYVSPFLEQSDIKGLIDQRLHGDFDNSSIGKALDIAIACTASRSIERPKMSDVLLELKHCLEVELSSGRERSSGPREEICTRVSISLEISSTDFSSMTGPSPR